MVVLENNVPPAALTAPDLPALPPLQLIWRQGEPTFPGGSRPDALLSIRYGEAARTFVAEYKPKWDARTLETAIRQARGYAEASSDAYPLVVLPYLSEEHLNTLLAAEVSGLDLCGNALIIAQGSSEQPDWLLRFTGQPNRFRLLNTLTEPYQGKAALVARTLLSVPVFPNARELQAEVQRRGGQVSQPVVSRALKAFQDDLVISADRRQGIMVVQPEKLLDRLVEGWRASTGGLARREERLLWRGRVILPDTDQKGYTLRTLLNGRASQLHQRLILTGLTSASWWTNLSSGDLHAAYVDEVGDLLSSLNAEETRRFPNLELCRPPDEAVYFDLVQASDGGRWASQVQTYLEMVIGDARTQAAAQALRASILGQQELRSTLLQAAGDQA